MSQLLSVDHLLAGIGNWTERDLPRYLALADAVEQCLMRDAVPPGSRLPSERPLAERLGLSRGTVVAAYAELADRGLVVRRQGSGTRVAGGEDAPPSAGVAPRAGGAAGASRPVFQPELRYPTLGRFVSGPQAQLDLSFGAPQLDEVTGDLMANAVDALRAGAPRHGYAPLGLPALREAVAGRIGAGGVPAQPDEILITSGAQGAISLLAAAMVRPGDRVIVEAPTYPGVLEIFARAGATVIALRRDHAGPRPEDLRRVLSAAGAALVFLVPTCHNPTGSVMHEQRRGELFSVCREFGVPLVEDETLAEVLFDGPAPPPIAARDPDAVISVGSFSKILWGGLRVGWVRASRQLILRLGRLKAAQDLGSGALDQLAVLGAFDRLDTVAEARRTQAASRYVVLRDALALRLPDWEVSTPRGGFSLWAQLPAGTGDEVAAAAMARGVAISSGAASAPDDLFLDHVRLCYAAPPEQIVEAVDRLAAAWAPLAARAAVAV